eukprot:scaffold42707_cov139-Skeletonema_dohrnii-CCMP3373.AAC.1
MLMFGKGKREEERKVDRPGYELNNAKNTNVTSRHHCASSLRHVLIPTMTCTSKSSELRHLASPATDF